MYFKRDIDKKLLKHFSKENTTPLILQGPPKIGKRTSLFHLEENFNQVEIVDLINFKSTSPGYASKNSTLLLHIVKEQTGNDFLKNPDNFLILLNADHVIGLYEIVSKLGKNLKCKLAVTITHADCLGDRYYDNKLLSIMKMERMQMQEFSQACYDYDLAAEENIFNLYSECGGYPEILKSISEGEFCSEYFVTKYIINFSKEFGYDCAIVLEVLKAFAELALAQHFTFTDLTFELYDYLERSYFGFSIDEKQLKKMLSDLITYGVLEKCSVYDIENEDGISCFALYFTDIIFYHHFTKKALCSKREKELATLEFYAFDAFKFGTDLVTNATFFCKGMLGCRIGNCLNHIKPLKNQELPFFMLQEVESGERTFITFNKVTEDKLLELKPDAKIVSYEIGKEYKLYGLR